MGMRKKWIIIFSIKGMRYKRRKDKQGDKMKKKLYKNIAAVLALMLVFLAGCGSTGKETNVKANGEEYTLKIGYGTVLCMAPLHIAIEKGYFDEEGLNYEVVKMDGLVTEYVGSGHVDASYGLVSKFIQPISNGLNITMTSGIHTGCIKLLVKKDSDIKNLEDLKGKNVGVNGLAEAPCVMLKRALDEVGVGVTPDNLEVNFVVYANSDLAMALDSGAVDAICLVDPAATVAANSYGYEVIFDNATHPSYANEYCCATFVLSDIVEKYPESAQKYTRAVMKAAAWVDDNPYEAAQFLIEKEYLSGDPQVFGDILASYEFTPSVQGGYEAVVKNVNEFVQIGLLDANTDVEAFIEKSFVYLENVEESY